MAVDLSPIGGAGAQFFDNNGVPLSGGKLYTYAAATTTPKACYTSSSGNVPHSNPIILDSAGRVPGGEIWLTSGEGYKFVLETPTSILLGTWDNIYGYTTGSADASTEVQTATAGQTLFVLNSMAYTPGSNTLGVYVDGVNQVVNNAYIESNSTSVTFVSGLHAGAVVKFINLNIASTDANVVTYEPGFTGSVATTVADKLQQTVSIKDFGAVGDGVADDTAAIQAALDTGLSVFVPSGSFYFTQPLLYAADDQAIYGEGNTSVLKHRGTQSAGPSWISTAGFSNVSITNLQIDGGYGATSANPCVWIRDGSANVTVENVFFNGGNQVVYLSDCSNIKIVNSSFYKCGYGIIQRIGFVSSHVLIDGNTCFDVYADFVEANCAATAPSENWVVTNNTYDTNSDYPSTATEGRFVGVTSVRGVIVSGNTVKKVAGDAAVHCEDTLGDTIITNNVFDNCLTSGGNLGYVFLLNNAENTIVSNNIFLRTDTTLPAAYAISTNSNSYSNAVIATGNLVRGESGSSNFNGFNLGFQDSLSATVCGDNIFQDLDLALDLTNNQNSTVTGNVFSRCTQPIYSSLTITNSVISSNNFVGTTGTNDIETVVSTKVNVQNNTFVANVDLGSATDVYVNDNAFNGSATLVNFGGTRAFAPVNIFASTGVSQSRYENAGTARQLSVSRSGVFGGGSASATFRVTAKATTANWRPGAIRIEAGACNGNGTNSTAAWWLYKFNVLGSNTSVNQSVADSGGTTGNYTITFTNVSASATEVVFDILVTANSAEYCSVDVSTVYHNTIVSIT